MATTTYQLRRMPADVNEILKKEKGKIMSREGKVYSMEQMIYRIVREWKEDSKVLKRS